MEFNGTIEKFRASSGGETSFENLCLACRSCNEFKADRTEPTWNVNGEDL
jgi:hypothetical protein